MKKIGVILCSSAFILIMLYLLLHIGNVTKAETNVEAVKSKIASTEEINKNSIENSSVNRINNMPEQLGYYYSEGEDYGTISFLDIESAIVVGTEADNLENKAMISSYSTENNKVILGHQYKDGSVFGKLYLLKEGDIVILTKMDGSIEEYSVDETKWVSETEYESEEGTAEIFDKSADLKLISCMKQDGERGRTIVSLSKN